MITGLVATAMAKEAGPTVRSAIAGTGQTVRFLVIAVVLSGLFVAYQEYRHWRERRA